MARQKNLSWSRGDTYKLALKVTTQGEAENLTGATLYFTVKAKAADADTAAVIRKSSGGLGGITITSAVNGEALVTINPADTNGLSPEEHHLYYDVQLKRSTGEIYTVADGSALIYPDMTISVA